MSERTPMLKGPGKVGWLYAAALLALLPGLGGSARLSYHEAIVAQGAREMLSQGDWLVPRLGGVPWLEKPPLAHWLVGLLGHIASGVDETIARLPTAAASLLLALGVYRLVARRRGRRAALFAGLCQATTLWGVTRGRLADCDMLLACLVTWSLVAFDGVRRSSSVGPRLAFFALLGTTALVKGIGFGGALVVALVLVVAAWDRDDATFRRLCWPTGWALAALIALAWPLLVLSRYPEALGLWTSHSLGRFGDSRFAGESLWEFGLTPFVCTLPWTPWVVAGALASWRRARRRKGGLDRLLWAWFWVPVLLLACSSARNGHYLLPALPACSAWAGVRLNAWIGRRNGRDGRKGLNGRQMDRRICGAAVALAAGWGAAYVLVGPRLDALGKGSEWAFYAELRPRLGEAPILLLYDAPGRPDRWDRAPYETPFGPVPPDLAPRLFYLGGDVRWCSGIEELAARFQGVIIARERDRAALETLGQVTQLGSGPQYRPDRAFEVFSLEPEHGESQIGSGAASSRLASGLARRAGAGRRPSPKRTISAADTIIEKHR